MINCLFFASFFFRTAGCEDDVKKKHTQQMPEVIIHNLKFFPVQFFKHDSTKEYFTGSYHQLDNN